MYEHTVLKTSFNEELAEIERSKNEKRKTSGIYYCKECGNKLVQKRKNMLCKECFDKNKTARIRPKQRKCEHPTRDVLKDLIRVYPFIRIGSMYGVTDNAVKKWCDNYSLPRTKKEIKKISDEEWENV